MRKFLSTIAAAGALALSVAAATPAAAFDFIGGWDVDYYNNNNWGLNIGTNADAGALNFDLNDTFPNDYQVVKLFDLWADENINLIGIVDADWAPKPIEISFNFTSPLTSGDVGGSTVGALGVGSLTWNNLGLQTFNFGDTGVMHVWVFNENLSPFFGKGEEHSTGVYAKFWLESMPSAVPEPATWAMMITGFGLAGAALRRRRSVGAIAA